MSGEERFDGMFMTVAQQAQGIEPLLDHLFGFLRRKTDFFAGASREKVENLVMKSLGNQADLHMRDTEKKRLEKERADRKKKELAEKKAKEAAEKAKLEASLKSSKDTTAKKGNGSDDVVEISDDGSFDLSGSSSLSTDEMKVPDIPKASNIGENGEELPVEEIVAPDGDGDIDEDDDKEPPPPGNGGSTDNYVWTQTLAEVEIHIPVPATTVGKLVKVDMTNTKLTVGLKGQPMLIDGELHKRIIVDDCVWTIEPGSVPDTKEIVINIAKHNKMEWWKCVMVGDPMINTQKVVPENSKLGDLDAETRQTVEKMMFDQRQKAMGLPSADELQKQDMMKKFMDAHPEMDFSKGNF